MATICVLSVGTKFILKWKKANVNQTVQKIGDFRRRLQNVMFFVENKPGFFCLNKQFSLKSHYEMKETFNEVDEFCWQLEMESMKWWKTMLNMMSSPILVLKKEKHLKN